MLKKSGADLQECLDQKGGINILYIAAQYGHDAIINYLLEN